MSRTLSHEPADAQPQRGMFAFSNARYADPVSKKYPIDTEDHIRAAWSIFQRQDIAAKYDKMEIETIKNRIKGVAEEKGIDLS